MAELEARQPTAASLDVMAVDDYLLQLLLPRFRSIFSQLSIPVPKNMPKTVLHAAMIWTLMADTPGSLALGLKIANNSRKRVLCYIVTIVMLPSLYEMLVDWYSTALPPQDVTMLTNSNINILSIRAKDRRRRLAKKIVDLVTRCEPIVRFTVLLSWWAGKVSAPTPALCLTGLSFVTALPQRDLNVAYAHRRWTYEIFLRTIQMISPIQSLEDAETLAGHMFSPLVTVYTRLFRDKSGNR